VTMLKNAITYLQFTAVLEKSRKNVTLHISDKFFHTQNFFKNRYYIRETNRLFNKFKWLTENRYPYTNKPISNISNIRYFCTTNNQSISYSFNRSIVTDLSHSVELKPANKLCVQLQVYEFVRAPQKLVHYH